MPRLSSSSLSHRLFAAGMPFLSILAIASLFLMAPLPVAAAPRAVTASPLRSASQHGAVSAFPSRQEWAKLQRTHQPDGPFPAIPSVGGSGNLTYHGGPVEHSPKTYIIFWGPSWTGSDSGAAQVVQNYFNDLGGTSFEDILTQYYDNNGSINNVESVGGVYFDTSSPSTDSTCGQATIQDSSLQSEVNNAIVARGWPRDGSNALYLVYTPSGDLINDAGGLGCSYPGGNYCAYHGWSSSVAVPYGAMPYPAGGGCEISNSPNNNLVGDSLTNLSSHEDFETISDMQLNAWYDSVGYEIGDKCAWDFSSGYTHLNNGGTFEVQTEYSDASSSCVNSYSGSTNCNNAPPIVSPTDGSALNTDAVTFSWNVPLGCSPNGYTFRINTSSDPTQGPMLDDTGIGGTSASFTFSADGTNYYWHVTACQPCSPWTPGPWSTAHITIDTTAPTASWVAPVTNGNTADCQAGTSLTLQVNATDNISVNYVDMIRYDAVANQWDTIATFTSPTSGSTYQANQDCGSLVYGWNQTNYGVWDEAGNGAQGNSYIWLYRQPLTPTNLTAQANSPNSVTLNWTNNDASATLYNVYRNGGVIAQVSNATTFQDTSAAPSTTYTYAVTAIVVSTAWGNVESPQSTTAQVTTAAPITTTGVFRPSNGALYLKNSNASGYADITLYYGNPGDVPVTGDWTGQGHKTIGIYRHGQFYLRNSNTVGYADTVFAFGTTGDIPVAGDWNGDGIDTVGIYRGGTWYLRNTNSAGPADIVIHFGAAGDIPVVGDWTGKGYDSIGVFRPSTGTFYLRNSNTTGYADTIIQFGTNGDLPVAGDWIGQGYDTIGVYRNGMFYLRDTNTTGYADIIFALGITGDQPITGPWIGSSVSKPGHRQSSHKTALTPPKLMPLPTWQTMPQRTRTRSRTGAGPVRLQA